MGNGQSQSSYPDKVGGCDQRRREATRLSIEIVREGAQTMGSDNARNFCINGTVRVRDVSFLQSTDVETWTKWTVSTKDHVFRRINSSLSGGRDERDGNRVAARRASEGPRLGRRTLEIGLLNEENSAQFGEEWAECAHRDELRDWYMVASYRLLS